MDELAVVNVPLDEIEAWVRATAATFLLSPQDPDLPRMVEAWRRDWVPEQAWGVRDGDRWVATSAVERRTMTVPGTGTATLDLTVDALTAVTVAATHRRRGLMSRMVRSSLDAARARGDALSILIAAEWPIYGRLGYAPATEAVDYSFRPGDAGPPSYGDPTTVRQVGNDELLKLGPDLFDRARRLRVGQLDRAREWWPRWLGGNGYEPGRGATFNWFVHDGPDGVDGCVGWKATRDSAIGGQKAAITTEGPIAASERAYADLWAYLAGIDLVDTVELKVRAVDEPIRWLVHDGRALSATKTVDFVWVRLLDLAACLSARRYAVPGRLVLEVVDADAGGPAAGRYLLDGGPDHADCEPTTDAPDVTVPQRTLASLYLGGHRLFQLPHAGGLVEHTPGAAALLDLMLSTPRPPWNQTWF